MLELNTEPELTWLTNASIVELGLPELPEFLAGQQGGISEKCTLSVVLLLLLFV